MPIRPLQPMFDTQGVVMLDGALATELERHGADLDDPLWSARLLVENPERIRQVHHAYLQAGADVISTASYQATFEGFARRGLTHAEGERLLRLSVQLALEARDAFWAAPANRAGRVRPLVAISIGPYGAYLADGSEYRGDYGLTVDDLIAFHRPRLAVLATCGADLVACETIPCLVEAEALVRLLAEYPALVGWLAFSCRDGIHVSHGEALATCAALAERSAQICAVGINCTAPRYIEELLAVAGTATQKPLLCYPNSGEAWEPAGNRWIDGTGTVDFRMPARRWFAAGARLIGGCCRTTPEDIHAMRDALIGEFING